jgi:hypothetical protein
MSQAMRPLTELDVSMHDATLSDLHFAIDRQEITLVVELDPDDQGDAPGILRLHFPGVTGFVVTHHGGDPDLSHAHLVDWGIGHTPEPLKKLAVAPGQHLYWFLITSWNAYVGIVAGDATFEPA